MRVRDWFFIIIITWVITLSSGILVYLFYNQDPLVSLPQIDIKRAQGPVKKITVFFPNKSGNSLTTVEKEIPGGLALIEQLKATIQLLTNNPPEGLINPVPNGAKLQSLFIDSLGNAYLDFSREIQQNHIGGLTAELLTIGSIVNTLLFNFKQIKGVQLLVEGYEIETLAGHVDCRKPFSNLLYYHAN